MPTVRELGLLANAVYDDSPAVDGWTTAYRHAAGGHLDGFQAATFVKEGTTVLAFRGTAQAMDAVADFKLGTGMNSTYFDAAENYANPYVGRSNVFITGHSLGGAITQVVANRRGFKFATFNAPGVAVLASRNIGSATLAMTGVRVVGMMASTLRHPIQAVRDVASAFNTVHGLNVCLENDVVSQIGVHYGEIIRIPGTSSNPLTEHRMTTMNSVLEGNPVGSREVSAM
ncbi:MAG TPA: hypothetical protein VG939_13630 [Caulobacteraceae bacterium]|nr:hypothetical protein [Caulobacteraceae bacterium]